MSTEDFLGTGPISAMQSFEPDVKGNQALASSSLQEQQYLAKSSAMYSFEGDVQGRQAIAPSQLQVQDWGPAGLAVTHAMIEGDVHRRQELELSQQLMENYGFAASPAMESLEGDVHGRQALDQSYVDRVHAPASVNLEGNNIYVDNNVTMEHGPQEGSSEASSFQTQSNMESKSRIRRSQHTQEDLVTMRNYYNGTSKNPKFAEILSLSSKTRLDFKQVQDFFTNEREREKKRKMKSGVVVSTDKRGHSDFQITVLKAWVAKNEPKDPRPTKKEKKEIACETGLSLEQVSGWFMNIRKKRKAALCNETSEESLNEDYLKLVEKNLFEDTSSDMDDSPSVSFANQLATSP